MTWLNARAPEIEARYGCPTVAETRWDASDFEAELLRRAVAGGREHDVTMLIRREDDLAVIRKPSYPQHIFRPPSGGVEPHESVETGALREAYEETGLFVALRVYLLRANVVFIPINHTDETITWTTHVFLAEWVDGEPLSSRLMPSTVCVRSFVPKLKNSASLAISSATRAARGTSIIVPTV